jgi:hypothetical protein
MTLKGASVEHDGQSLADRWAVDPEHRAAATRWSIDPDADLRRTELSAAGNRRR